MARKKSGLSTEEKLFIEDFGMFGMRLGLPRTTGKVLGFMLICEPAHQTAEDIREMLHLSLGSTSIATRSLTSMGLLNRIALPDDRRFYYQLPPDGFKRSIQQRFALFSQAPQKLAQKGLELKGNAKNDRLLYMRDLYLNLEKELTQLVTKMNAWPE